MTEEIHLIKGGLRFDMSQSRFDGAGKARATAHARLALDDRTHDDCIGCPASTYSQNYDGLKKVVIFAADCSATSCKKAMWSVSGPMVVPEKRASETLYGRLGEKRLTGLLDQMDALLAEQNKEQAQKIAKVKEKEEENDILAFAKQLAEEESQKQSMPNFGSW